MTQTQKQNTTKSSNKPAPAAKPAQAAGPAGYQNAEEMIQPAGYWLPEKGPLHGVLVAGFEYKQKSGRGRGQLRTIYIFKLLDPTPASVKLEGGGLDETMLEKGDLCAVFHSVGLRSLAELSGCAVYLERKPEKRALQNGNSMWDYVVRYKGERKTLRVRQALTTTDAEDEKPDLDPEDFDRF